MTMRTINDSLYDLLMAQGISAGRPASPKRKGAERSANRKASRINRRGAAIDGALSQVAAAKPEGTAQEVRNGVWLAWSNPTTTRKRAGGKAPLLVIV